MENKFMNTCLTKKAQVMGYQIEETKSWHPERVQQCCIENGWYTRGTNAEYEKMLDYVRESKPTISNVFTVAKDIYSHSDFDSRYDAEDEVIEAIMFHLNCDAIVTSYFIQ